MMQGRTQAAQRPQPRRRTIRHTDKPRPVAPDNDKPIHLRTQGGGDMIDQRHAIEQGCALVRAKTGRTAPGNNRTEQGQRSALFNRRIRPILLD